MTGELVEVRPVDDEHQVVTVEAAPLSYRRRPCGGCPWRLDQVGSFPADAFRHSARTAHDLSGNGFGCHESGIRRPATCAGFLLRGAEHNLSVRIRIAAGELDPEQVDDGGHPLHDGYTTMAIANGVPADDPALEHCRPSAREHAAGVR